MNCITKSSTIGYILTTSKVCCIRQSLGNLFRSGDKLCYDCNGTTPFEVPLGASGYDAAYCPRSVGSTSRHNVLRVCYAIFCVPFYGGLSYH